MYSFPPLTPLQPLQPLHPQTPTSQPTVTLYSNPYSNPVSFHLPLDSADPSRLASGMRTETIFRRPATAFARQVDNASLEPKRNSLDAHLVPFLSFRIFHFFYSFFRQYVARVPRLDIAHYTCPPNRHHFAIAVVRISCSCAYPPSSVPYTICRWIPAVSDAVSARTLPDA